MNHFLKVVVLDGRDASAVDLPGKDLEEVVDADLADFEKFMMEKVDDSGPLSGPEKAILKSWIWWKTHAEEASSSL